MLYFQKNAVLSSLKSVHFPKSWEANLPPVFQAPKSSMSCWSFNVGRNVLSGFQTRVPFKIVKTLYSNKFSSQGHPVHTVSRTRISSKFVAHPQIYHYKFHYNWHPSKHKSQGKGPPSFGPLVWDHVSKLFQACSIFRCLGGSMGQFVAPQSGPSWRDISPIQLEPKGAEVKMMKWNFKRFLLGLLSENLGGYVS